MGLVAATGSMEAPASAFVQNVVWFYYRIGNHKILLEPTIRAEIIAESAISPVPFAPEWCLGLTSLRGDLFPVLDMHKILQGKRAGEKATLLLVTYPQINPVILTCDGYPQPLHLDPDHLEPETSTTPLPSWIPQVLRYQEQIFYQADHRLLFRQLRQLTPKT